MSSPILVIARLVLEFPLNREVLFVQRAGGYKQGGICLPGGKVEVGERIEEALRREIKDEIGLEGLDCPRFLFYLDRLPEEEDGRQGINLIFGATYYRGKIVLNEESVGYEWLRREQADDPRIVFGCDRILKKYFDEGYAVDMDEYWKRKREILG